jgi:hypothetical protein
MNENRKVFYEKFDARLEELSAQLAQLKARSLTVKAELLGDYAKATEAFQHKHSEAWARLKELKESGNEARGDLARGLERILAEGKVAYHEAVARFH